MTTIKNTAAAIAIALAVLGAAQGNVAGYTVDRRPVATRTR